ncbi:MAG: 50S ribosomal protein L25 [Chloroflexi bacterium]|nr:50S ribosomal protein L25 [Chloroflexota bacterium]
MDTGTTKKQIELAAQTRTVTGKHVARLRREGIVPANIFGHGASRAIQAPLRALEHLFAEGGRTHLVSLLVEGAAQPALVKSFTRDSRTGKLTHVDFQAVSMTERVSSTVPVRFTGEAPAVRSLGGVLLHPMTELKIEALAGNLPESVEVDLTGLVELGSSIHVSHLTPPSGVLFLDPPDTVIAVVNAPITEEEPAGGESAADAASTAAPADPASGTGS